MTVNLAFRRMSAAALRTTRLLLEKAFITVNLLLKSGFGLRFAYIDDVLCISGVKLHQEGIFVEVDERGQIIDFPLHHMISDRTSGSLEQLHSCEPKPKSQSNRRMLARMTFSA